MENLLAMPLHQAVVFQHTETAKILIENGADVNASTRYYHTWTTAIVHNDTDMVKLLLKHNADTELPNDNGYTALAEATINGNREIVRLLLDHGANVHTVIKVSNTSMTFFSFSALGLAAVHNIFDIVKLLVTYGADTEIPVTTKDRHQYVPIHAASKNGFVEIAEILIQAGANVNSKSSTGGTPLDFALQKNQSKTADLLIRHGAHRAHKEGIDDNWKTVILILVTSCYFSCYFIFQSFVVLLHKVMYLVSQRFLGSRLMEFGS
jgi:ankyrin repeat protein